MFGTHSLQERYTRHAKKITDSPGTLDFRVHALRNMHVRRYHEWVEDEFYYDRDFVLSEDTKNGTKSEVATPAKRVKVDKQ